MKRQIEPISEETIIKSRNKHAAKLANVIICTYNRSRSLERTLRSLARQTVKPAQLEIVVVDDGSSDGTAEACTRLQDEIPNMRYVPTGRNVGVGSASNLGIHSAESDIVLFTDDDCVPREDWVERMSAALEREAIVAGAVVSPTSNYVKLCHNIAQFHPFMPGRKARCVDFVAGANMGFKRSALEDLGGFQEENMAVDMELIVRARLKGYQTYFAPDALVTHDPDRTSVSTVLKYAAKHASRTILLRNQYRSLLRTPFVLASPTLVLLASPLIALTVTLGIYLRNLSLFRLFWTAPLVYAIKLAWCWGAARGLRTQRRRGSGQ